MLLERTDPDNHDYIALVELLDAELRVRDGEEHEFYAAINKASAISNVVVAYEGITAVGCGAIKDYGSGTAEIKRMYVVESRRGRGIATAILHELEKWAGELNYQKCILETGKNQPEAISLYKKSNWQVIPNYGQYEGCENSVCFEKAIVR
ncbi:MAG: GNAT family N-acetyltransferase [Flavobacterium sp.]|nr:MAG: GNAT family N-acetyltransferase [Flavobacterium sp.]